MKEPQTTQEALEELEKAWIEFAEAVIEELNKFPDFKNPMLWLLLLATFWMAFCWTASLL